jgi:hypothetical protein
MVQRHLAAMQHIWTQLWAFHIWTVVAASSALVALFSIIADRRRQQRTRLEKVGFMPWTGLSVMATLLTVISIALALKAG